MAVHGLPASALARLAALGLDGAAGREVLWVRTAAAGKLDPAVLGRRSVAEGALWFMPRLPFRPGLDYRARFDGGAFDRLTGAAPGTTATREISFTPLPPERSPPTRVEAIYPSAEVLPENQLRLYVWFSAPMRRRAVADAVRLVDEASGERVEMPFVEVPDGLWDPSGRRLTLFFHPGRVKRGVGPRLALGPPLRAGNRYRLEIGAGLRDAVGRPLAADHVKSFAVGPPDRRRPDPSTWSLSAPPMATGALVVDFPEPLDHGLLLRLLEVRDAAGRRIEGEATVSRGERRWAFRPQTPWRPGGYLLRVSAALEDLAGNTVDRLFDEATEPGRQPRPPARDEVDLAFVVAGGP